MSSKEKITGRVITAEDAGVEWIDLLRRSDGAWPAPIGERALIGITGEVLRVLEPTTEGDPNAMVMQFLAGVSNLLGNRPNVRIGSTRHALRIWVLVVGKTATGKKGSGISAVLELLEQVDPSWKDRCMSGVRSGEGIVSQVRDAQRTIRRRTLPTGMVDEKVDIVEGVADKRLFLKEEEFSRVLRISRRDGSTLSATIREAWDCDVLMTTSKHSPERATGAHVVIVGHITPAELRMDMKTRDMSNGFANRFLYACSRRSKRLAMPTAPEARLCRPLIERLQAIKRYVDTLSEKQAELRFSEAALRMWEPIKNQLDDEIELAEAGDLLVTGAITRGAPHVVRLAALYALLDRSRQVEPRHLHAAREVWRYSAESARLLFREEQKYETIDRVVEALQAARDKRMKRSEVAMALGGHRSRDQMDQLRNRLIALGKIEAFREKQPRGRPVEYWVGR